MTAKASARVRWLRTVSLAAILFALVAAISAIPVVHEFQLRLADSYFRTAPPVLRRSPVVLVLIDDRSLRTYGRWPWSRPTVAHLVRQLDAAGAGIIGLDILFAEQQSPAADGELADAIRASHRTVIVDKIGTYPDGPRWIEPVPLLSNAAVGVGHSQAVLDTDGICRRFPVRELSVDGPRLAFALEVARKLDPSQAASFLAQYGIDPSDDDAVVVSAVPVLAPIAFRRDEFETISVVDVLSDRNLAKVRGRPVLVGFGPTEITDRLNTPLTGQLPAAGVEVHAQILDSVLSDRSLRSLGLWVSALLLFATCLGAVSLFRNRRGWRLLALVIGLGALSYFVGLGVFVLQSRIPPIGPMLVAVVFAPVVVYGADFVAVDRSIRTQLMGLRQWLIGHRLYQLAEDPDDIGRSLDVLQQLQTRLGALYELHQTLLKTTHDAVGIFDVGGTLILQNQKFGTIFGSQMHFTRLEDIQTLLQWRKGLNESAGAEAEAQVRGELFSIRKIALPPTTLSPQGGTIWILSSLQAREERDRSRAEVLGFITHELRTPLTAIQGFSELMIEFPGSPHCTNAPETIFRESKRLLALIHSYLDVLRLDAGARDSVFEQIDVARLVRKVFDVLQPIAAASGMTLAWQGDDAFIFGDEALLHGAILNLVSNAIKYGEKSREIAVRYSREGTDVSIAVHNFGSRIDSHDLPNLFGSYYRGTGVGERTPGWGLGLAFVKRIAEKHGGRVTVESSENGTTFSVHVPAPVPMSTLRSLS